MRREGVWQFDGVLPPHVAQPKSVREAGFKGLVTDSHHARRVSRMHPHDWPTDEIYEQRKKEETPDHVDDYLGHFVEEHGSHAEWVHGGGKLEHVDLSKGVYATQTHVGQYHIDRYLKSPNDKAWYLQHNEGKADDDEKNYVGNYHPMFVTHQGRLHATEGHHRVAAALARGDKTALGWHFNLDEHPVNNMSDLHQDEHGQQSWGMTHEKCPDCESFNQ